MRLIVMRRAETGYEVPTTTPTLGPKGIEQVDSVSKAVSAEKPGAVVSSEMPRALASAQELATGAAFH